MHRTAVINVVGLTSSMLGPEMPRLGAFLRTGAKATIDPVLPALTCSAQSSYLTGKLPAEHGIVANGWYNRELAEVQFWKQSNHLVQGKKLWESLREEHPGFTCAKLFWWYNMYSTADYSITPRPIYPADGRKIFDIYTGPLSIRDEIKQDLGEFPFPAFWGPAAGVSSPQGRADGASRWIAESAKWIEKRYQPGLSLIYLPHLDYNLQRLGPDDPGIAHDLRAIDSILGELIEFFDARSIRIVILSEYGITAVNQPIHLNRAFRQQGWLAIKDEIGLELLDCGASRAFAVADHQVAHIYLNDPTIEKQARALIESQPGIGRVFNREEQKQIGLQHPRSGDLVAFASENAWFTYYYWLDDAVAPDFARCVDIHRKPGYDPVELFIDPAIKFPKLKIARRLLQKKLGCRMLMDLIPLDASLVKGSHGFRPRDAKNHPVIISQQKELLHTPVVQATDIFEIIKSHVGGR
jgi:predicted AlkP superfamily pyrophosphatase or phosphodiesterase